MKKRILLGASYSVIEPLGLLHLGGLARDLNWDRNYHLVKNHDFESFFEHVREFKPDVVGFNVYTGNHSQLAEAYRKIKKDHPNILTIVGGPHPTYFPTESNQYSDFVVMSEGFGALRKILEGEATPGILPMSDSEKFPFPDREEFYAYSPEHARSPIKSMITMTGCPYKCTYCYNSSTPKDLGDNISPELAEQLAKSMGLGGRLFPHNVRPIEDVLAEGQELAEKWNTKVIYNQDDVFGFDEKKDGFLEKFARQWPDRVGIPFHAQMRWEMTIKDSGERRLDLIREAGGFGLTLAIEAADYTLRKEILDRAMPEETMFEGMKNVINRGFKVRTEQISGLIYGSTSKPTPMNIDADLGLVELNVRLRELSGGPTMAWASTFAPYPGSKLGNRTVEERFYYLGQGISPQETLKLLADNLSETFFDKTRLRFLKEWVGPSLKDKFQDESIWLQGEELEIYRNQNAELRRIFNLVTLVPEGHVLARNYLESPEPFSYERLGKEIESHISYLSNGRGSEIKLDIENAKLIINSMNLNPEEKNQIQILIPYFGVLPKSELAIQRYLEYGREKGFNSTTLSTATRHHLYDNVLYYTGEDNSNSRAHEIPTSMQSQLKI